MAKEESKLVESVEETATAEVKDEFNNKAKKKDFKGEDC